MKDFKSIFVFLLIVVLIIAGSYWAYKNGYLKNPNQTNTAETASNNKIGNDTVSKAKENKVDNNVSVENNNSDIKENEDQKNDNTVEEQNTNKDSYTGKEEVDQKNVENKNDESNGNVNKENKAIEAVKSVWWGDEGATFNIDNSNSNLKANELMVKVTNDGAQYFYIVNTDTWTASEF